MCKFCDQEVNDANPLVPHPLDHKQEIMVCSYYAIQVEYEYSAVMTGRQEAQESGSYGEVSHGY